MDFKLYDLGDQYELITFLKGRDRVTYKKTDDEGNLPPSYEEESIHEYSREEKDRMNQERSIRRSKSQIRRSSKRHKLRYFWTLTFSDQYIDVFHSGNGKKQTYDVGDPAQAWKLWKLFISRCHKSGFNFPYICTMELQEKRLIERGEKCFHFHFVTSVWLPQNQEMARQNNTDFYIEKYWDFGFVKAKGTSKQSWKVTAYIVKYIAKLFDENMKGKQRYRISENLNVPSECFYGHDMKTITGVAMSIGKVDYYASFDIEGIPCEVHFFTINKDPTIQNLIEE